MKTMISSITYNVINRKGYWLIVRQSPAGVHRVARYVDTPTACAAAHAVATALNAQAWREL